MSRRGKAPAAAPHPPARHPAPRPQRAPAHPGSIPPALAGIDRACQRFAIPLVALMIAAWAGFFTYHAWLKYRFYLYSDIDLPLFVQAVDGILHGTLYSSIRALYWLGDHSSLILFLVAPLYAVARHPVTLPALQSLALALGAIPVFALARREIGGGLVPLACAALYLLYPALGYTALYEFHPEVLCTSALLAAFACYRTGRLGWTLGWTGLALLGKEDIVLPVLAFALYVLLDRRPRRLRNAALLAGLALLSLVISFAVLKPAFSAGEVNYGSMYQRWGDSPRAVAIGIATRPFAALGALFMTPGQMYDSVIKLQYYLHMLLPLLFLPLLSPLTLLIALPTLASHMLSWRPAQHTIFYQYTATVTPFVVAAAVLGMRNLVARRPTPWLGHALVLAALAASLLANLQFGPILGRGRWQLVGAEESIAPSGEERAMARRRDAMMAMLGDRDSVVAGFEFLSRLANRRNTRSFHNVVGGTYTFSTRPFPELNDVTALIADASHVRIRPYGDLGTAGRIRGLIERNRLGMVAAAGDLFLFLRDAPDSVRLWQEGEAPIARPQRVVFDRQLAFLGDEYLANTVEPGGLLPIRTFWRKVAPTDSLYILQLTAYDAREKAVFSHMRYLGTMLHPAGEWPDTTMVAETYRMVIPDDARPGTYMLGMRVGRRDALDQVLSETDDPVVRSQNMVVELGRFTIVARR